MFWVSQVTIEERLMASASSYELMKLMIQPGCREGVRAAEVSTLLPGVWETADKTCRVHRGDPFTPMG